jgi:hypothetical protein
LGSCHGNLDPESRRIRKELTRPNRAANVEVLPVRPRIVVAEVSASIGPLAADLAGSLSRKPVLSLPNAFAALSGRRELLRDNFRVAAQNSHDPATGPVHQRFTTHCDVTRPEGMERTNRPTCELDFEACPIPYSPKP